MEDELSLKRNSTVKATDSLEVAFFKEVLPYILCFWSSYNELLISVSIKPPTIQLDLTPRAPHSLAVFFEKASRAPFVDAYIASPL